MTKEKRMQEVRRIKSSKTNNAVNSLYDMKYQFEEIHAKAEADKLGRIIARLEDWARE